MLETRSDGKLTLGLTQVGRKKITPMAQQFLEKLKETGELPLTDDSTPAAIQKHLGMSKKSFKQVVGQLYKQKKIALEPTRIVWIDD